MIGLQYIMEQIEDRLLQNMSIAVLTITFWMIRAEGMTTDNLDSVMEILGFNFNSTANTLTADGTTYNIYQLLEYCVYTLFPSVKVLTVTVMECVIDKAAHMEYITKTESEFLLSEVIKQVPEVI